MGRRAQRRRRLLAGLAVLLCGGCQFLQNEFCTLDRSPPGVRAPAPPHPW